MGDSVGIHDPKSGDIWGCIDGGQFYVTDRKPKMVRVQRRPFGDSQAKPHWIRLSTFNREADLLLSYR